MGVSRIVPRTVKPGQPLASPKGELFWTKKYGPNCWIYPGWPLNLRPHRVELAKAGYALFVTLSEPRPKALEEVKRTGEFNWALPLL